MAEKIGLGETQAPEIERKRSPEQRVPVPIEVRGGQGKVFVLETELELNEHPNGLVPNPENFKHFTLDARTLQTLEKIATAVELREPCLLEGETSTSKTSSIEYLAMVTRNSVVRMNLNGQTDTSELVGKFVPNDGKLQMEFSQLLSRPDVLSPETRRTLEAAQKEGRALNLVECQKIAHQENIQIPEWRWQNGIVPEAMTRGQWVILDELNLAEPQILERLNSVIEKNPSITLSENGGTKIGPGGQSRIDPRFRIFGTMNPAEYTGRAAMSPAFKDRWPSYKFVERPNEDDYAAMMNLMVYGEQPEVTVHGQKYKGEQAEPLFKKLSQVPNFRGFILKLAKFQVKIEDLARQRTIGKDKKEKYIFTRRSLIEFLGFLEDKTVVQRGEGKKLTVLNAPKEIVLRALQYYFLDKISDPEDLKKVKDQLDAIGISEDVWQHEFKEAEKAKPPVPPAPPIPAAPPVPRPEVRTPGSAAKEKFKALYGGEFETSGIREVGEFKIGDLFKVRPGRELIPQVMKAKKLEIVGFMDDDGWRAVTQIDGGKCTSDPIDDFGRFFEKIEVGAETAKWPRVKFISVAGGGEYETSGVQESGGHKVGDLLRIKPGRSLRSDVMKAKKLEIIGFMDDGRIVTQLDGRLCVNDSIDVHEEYFEKIEAEAGEDEEMDLVREYKDMGGRDHETSAIQALGVYKVGDLLKARSEAGLRKEVMDAKKLEVIGFTMDGNAVIQVDGNLCIEIGIDRAVPLFEKAEAEPGKASSRKVIGVEGKEIEVSEAQEKEGFKVGSLFKVKPTFITAIDEVLDAKKIELVGFTPNDMPVLQLDGGRCVTSSFDSLRGSRYEKIG